MPKNLILDKIMQYYTNSFALILNTYNSFYCNRNYVSCCLPKTYIFGTPD